MKALDRAADRPDRHEDRRIAKILVRPVVGPEAGGGSRRLSGTAGLSESTPVRPQPRWSSKRSKRFHDLAVWQVFSRQLAGFGPFVVAGLACFHAVRGGR